MNTALSSLSCIDEHDGSPHCETTFLVRTPTKYYLQLTHFWISQHIPRLCEKRPWLEIEAHMQNSTCKSYNHVVTWMANCLALAKHSSPLKNYPDEETPV